MNVDDEKIIQAALLKRATGYDAEEITEEYADSEGEIKLTKRKVTKKNVPPDITAIKLLIEGNKPCDLTTLTDEELIKEKQRLLELLNTPNGVKEQKEKNEPFEKTN